MRPSFLGALAVGLAAGLGLDAARSRGRTFRVPRLEADRSHGGVEPQEVLGSESTKQLARYKEEVSKLQSQVFKMDMKLQHAKDAQEASETKLRVAHQEKFKLEMKLAAAHTAPAPAAAPQPAPAPAAEASLEGAPQAAQELIAKLETRLEGMRLTMRAMQYEMAQVRASTETKKGFFQRLFGW